MCSFTLFKRLKPIFHLNTKYLASGAGVGQCPRRVTQRVTQRKIYQHVGIFWRYPRRQSPIPILKFALPPTPNPDASQWNKGGVGLSGVGAGVGHVHFMLFISFASGTQRKLVFQWNMGFRIETWNQGPME